MQVVIIGNGITGISCARHIRKLSDHKITVISSESKHFYSRTALMYIYMGHMRFTDTKPYEDWFWEKNRIDLVHDLVEGVDVNSKSLALKSGETIQYDKLVIATGSSSNKFGWPGQDLQGVQGMYNLQDLQLMEQNSIGLKRAVIVGGGLIGIEMAEMFLSRDIEVTMLVREESFWDNVLPPGESDMINRHVREHHIDLRLTTELKEIKADPNGRVASVITNHGEQIECGFVGLTVGVHPNVGFLKDSGIEIQKGVLVNEFLETNIEDVYAAGDCAQFINALEGRRPVEQVWYTGKMQGITLAQTICNKKVAYQPGHWFNSAKFLDIEYQTYGIVPNKLNENMGEFYWEDDDGKKCIHLVYERSSNKFIGINTLGVRYRHHLFNQFLTDNCSIKEVIEMLPSANFDPEFFDTFEAQLLIAYNQRFPDQPIKRQSENSFKSFLKIFKPVTT